MNLNGKILLILQILTVILISSCRKEEVDIDDSQYANSDGEIVLGNKIKNAYSVENMRLAYKSLKEKGKFKSASTKNINIEANFLYVRFLPKDTADVNVLHSDTALEYFDYPLDYEIKKEGDYYHDPTIPKEQPTWQYTVVPVDYKFPNVEYEIIEKCFIPEDEQNNLKSANDYSDLFAMVEYESMKLTDNLSEEDKVNKSKLKGWFSSWFPSKTEPEGTIQVYNTYTEKLEGVRGVKVRTHRIVKIRSAYTDTLGRYKISGGYRYKRVHYALIFQNVTGFKIWGNRAFFAPARYNLGWHDKHGHSTRIYKNFRSWLWATVNNATHIYREKLCPKFGINKPPRGLRLWTLRMGGNNLGSAPMSRQISLNFGTLKDFVLAFGFSRLTRYVSLVSPDIFIVKNFKDTREAYSTVFHELAHASHYTRAGKWYWMKYIAGIIVNRGNYGNGRGIYDGHIGVGEMWGNYFEYICMKDYFGSASVRHQSGWYKPQILQYIDNGIYGMTPYKIFKCLQSDVTDHYKLKSKLIYYYGHSNQINKIFSNNGF